MKDLDRAAVDAVLTLARRLRQTSAGTLRVLCQGYILGTLFYQPSTRTRLSFVSAAQRLGAQVLGFESPGSTRAGDYYRESLDDVVGFTSQYADALVLRHHETGGVKRAAAVSAVPLINAGDGYNEHPTQALLDILTLEDALGRLDGRTFGLVGDLSIRVHRSLLYALRNYRVKELLFLLPDEVAIPPDMAALLKSYRIEYRQVEHIDEIFDHAEAIVTIGVHHPRHDVPHADLGAKPQTEDRFRVTQARVLGARRFIPILHPAPIGDEVERSGALLPQYQFFKQARNGLWVRAALLAGLFARRTAEGTHPREHAFVAEAHHEP